MAALDVEHLNRQLRKLRVVRQASGQYAISPLLLLPLSEAADFTGESVDQLLRYISGRRLVAYWPRGRDAEVHLNLFAVLGWTYGETRSVPAEWMDPEPTAAPRVVPHLVKSAKPAQGVNRKLRFKVLGRDGFTCRYCGRKAGESELEVDHIVPRSAGGTNDEDNLVTACYDCNRGKHALVGVQAPALVADR